VNLLLDTHVLLWWLADNPTLSAAARTAIADSNNIVFVSAVTAWEITIKKALGKLSAPDNLAEEITNNRFLPLPVTISHAIAVGKLPPIHQDPFDRLLAAQATIDNLTLLTRDVNLKNYSIPFISA
jgi:PIN domain nuclease of toxin-antitoxin system